jgi:hypothetical protein
MSSCKPLALCLERAGAATARRRRHTNYARPARSTDRIAARCVERLEDWDEQIADLLAFVGPATFVRHRNADLESWECANEARRPLDKLKRELRVEAESVGRRELTVVEANYYAHPVEQTAAYLTLQAAAVALHLFSDAVRRYRTGTGASFPRMIST